MLDDPNFAGTPISPRSTAFIAKGNLHQNSTVLLVNIIRSLTATIKSWEETHKTAISSFDDTIAHLDEKIKNYKDTFCIPPKGYVENNGHYPNLHIQVGKGLYRPTKWIKQLDNYCVAALCDTDLSSSSPTITNVYAAPSRTSSPVKPLPRWLLDLLTRNPTTYSLIQNAAGELYDWGVAADLDQFRVAHNQMVDAYKQVDSYTVQAEAHFRAKAAIQSQLKLAKIAEDLNHLKGLSDHHTLNEGNVIWSSWKKPEFARGRAD
jgi:hypothetical protein